MFVLKVIPSQTRGASFVSSGGGVVYSISVFSFPSATSVAMEIPPDALPAFAAPLDAAPPDIDVALDIVAG